MKRRYIVAIAIAITLTIEFLMSRTWLGKEVLLSIIDPDSDPYADCLVLTNDVTIGYGSNTVGTLQAGQIIFQPCRHDVFLTEPCDPRVWKIYVEFGEDNGQSIVDYRSNVKRAGEMRNVVFLKDGHKHDH